MAKFDLSEIDVPTLIADMWEPLNDEQKEILASHFTLQTYKKNEVIHCEGETPTHLMCLLKGKVKVYKDGVGGRSQIIRVIKPVEYFGYRAYFSGADYITAAAAFEPSLICLLIFLKESYGVEEDGSTLSIYLSREDLANLSNMTTSNAIRTLSQFAAERLIAIDGRKIKLIDEDKLKKISKIG